MPDGNDARPIYIAPAISELDQAEWDTCAGSSNPFVSYGFLSALEDSGSVSDETGWLPHHLSVRDQEGKLAAVAPLYLKTHSYGEYVFDWGWADAYERAGGDYYPKLQSGVPFTPVTGPRLLVRADLDPREYRRLLGAAMIEIARQHALSSIHITFCEKDEPGDLESLGFMRRTGLQYHWENRGYENFDDFLASLNSRKRKAIKKERRKVAEAGIELARLTGDEIKPHHWDLFDHFYRATADKKWGVPYLTREFWDLLGERVGDKVVLVTASHEGQIVGAALNLAGEDALYGRNWGALASFRFLHFETCYYQAIEHAIANGLQRVEAGAQGEHKIQRGYLPVETHSCHWIADPGFRGAVESFLQREAMVTARDEKVLFDYSPFKKA